MNVAQKKNNEKGFTIIEVVLVLAIAALIFLMVFIALPALQRSQRDTQRKNDISKFVSQLSSYSTNNRGKLPPASDVDDFARSYLKWSAGDAGEFKDPLSQTGYELKGDAGDPKVGEIQYARGSKCNDESLSSGAGNGQAAVRTQLENGGIFCQDAK